MGATNLCGVEQSRRREPCGDMKYLMVADLHSAISEVDACIDRMKVFIETLHDHVGQTHHGQAAHHDDQFVDERSWHRP
jgi:hypothetical protein